MGLKNEILEDTSSAVEAILQGTFRTFEFVGRKDKSIIAINGVGSGWRKQGLRAIMEKYKLSGELIHWGLLEKGVDYYLPLLDTEVQKYDKPWLMGFSSGGYIPLLYAARGNNWGQIGGIITVATLFQGNPPILKYFGGILKETVPGSQILKEVVAIVPPEGKKVISILPKEDKFGTLPENVKLNWSIIRTEAQSHGGMQNQKKWYEEIIKREIGIN
jgi:hypothetical protein